MALLRLITTYEEPRPTSTTTTSPRLDRRIGPFAMLLLGVTSIIGSGWLFAALYAAQMAGPAAVLSWLVGGIIVIVLALIYAELGGMLPVAGALASIPRFSHGTLSGFTAGWLCWIAYVTVAPIEVSAVLEYATNYLPWLSHDIGGEKALTGAGIGVAASLMAIFSLVNMLGVQWLARSSSTITIWKLAVPLVAAAALMLAGFQFDNFHAFGGFAPDGFSGVFAAVSGGGVLFSLLGFRVVVDMAGEARNPQKTIPFAIIGAVFTCLVIYILLQVAFVGVIPASHLDSGWHNIVENVMGGPFAGFAALLGLQWLAMLLYADAIISPAGTGLSYIGTTARINYAMAESGQFPSLFARLNASKVPVWALLFNFVVGMIMFLPFPGWAELVGFISSASILSFSFGPVAMAALRHQAKDLARPYKAPLGLWLAAIAFIFVGFANYWSGWDTNWKVFLLTLAGLVMFLAIRLRARGKGEPLHARQSGWFWLFAAGLALLSWLGNYGNGLGVLPQGIDLLLVSLWSLLCFWLGLRWRLPNEDTNRMIAAAT